MKFDALINGPPSAAPAKGERASCDGATPAGFAFDRQGARTVHDSGHDQ
jgi:hypothetical protein